LGCEISDDICKNHDSCASADSPIDSVSAAGSVRMQQNFISELKFSIIDFLS